MRSGEQFNPWRGACGFYPPDAVSRLGPVVILGTRRKLSHGHKCLYILLVRRWGRQGPCFPGQVGLAKELGASQRAVRMWIEDLEAFGLILRRRRGRGKGGDGQPDEYSFLWHVIFDRQIPSIMTGKNDRFDRQISSNMTGKNQQSLYSEEAHTSKTHPASQPADSQFAEELKRLINGHKHPAGRWIEGCSQVRLSDELLLSALVQTANDRGLSARDVATVWACKALAIDKRAARADDPDAYFRAAILAELMAVNLAQSKPAVTVTSLPDEAFTDPHDQVASIALNRGWQWIHPSSDCPHCAGFGRDVESEKLCECHSGQHLRNQGRGLKAESASSVFSAQPLKSPDSVQFHTVRAVSV